MLAHQRHDEILRQVNINGSVRVTDLVTELGVSEMTVRRDISLLATQGKLERVHGGAVRLEDMNSAPSALSAVPSNEEKIIAQAAAETIRPGSKLFIGAGGSGRCLAKIISESEIFSSLTVATNYLPAIRILDEAQQMQRDNGRAHAEVIFFGGQPSGHETLGSSTVITAYNFHFHSVFIEAEGIDAQTGLSCNNLDKAMVEKVLIENSEFATVMVPTLAWRRSALGVVCPLNQISRVISVSAPPSGIAESLTEAQVMVDIREP